MAEKKMENKKVLVAGFHIVWATDHCINKDTQIIIDSLTSLLLAKAYYSLFLPEHFGSWCYYCHLKHMILRTIIDREDNYRYFYSEFKLDEFEEKGSPYLFYDEWLKKTQLVKTQHNPPVKIFVLQKLYMINIICSNKFIISFFFVY